MPETRTQPDIPSGAPHDPSDEAMCARARERFTGDRGKRVPRRRMRHAAFPNLIIIGGLKCGTTSIHHYLGLHPEIQMSKPKELNFFVSELNWDLGLDWYKARFDARFEVRGESSPHYTNLPRFTGVAERIRQHCPDAKLIYMVRDPIKRVLSHWVHAKGAGYESGDIDEVLSRPDSAYGSRPIPACWRLPISICASPVRRSPSSAWVWRYISPRKGPARSWDRCWRRPCGWA